MISTFLAVNPWVTTVSLLAVILAGPFVAYAVSTKPRLAWLLAGVSAVAVLVITLLPQHYRAQPGCHVSWALPSLGAVELVANILLFVPVVLFAAAASHRVVLAVVGGSVFSVLIEAFQAAVPALGRACDTGDWVQNSIGAVLGGVLAAIALGLQRRRVKTT